MAREDRPRAIKLLGEDDAHKRVRERELDELHADLRRHAPRVLGVALLDPCRHLVADGKDRDAQPQAALRRRVEARRFVTFTFTGAEEFTGLSKRPSPQSSSRL